MGIIFIAYNPNKPQTAKIRRIINEHAATIRHQRLKLKRKLDPTTSRSPNHGQTKEPPLIESRDPSRMFSQRDGPRMVTPSLEVGMPIMHSRAHRSAVRSLTPKMECAHLC